MDADITPAFSTALHTFRLTVTFTIVLHCWLFPSMWW